MTYCGTLAEPITRRVAEGMNLDDIANEMCTSVKDPRQKLIRIIKELLGEDYLIENSEVLQYDVGKAKLGRIPKHPKLRKIETAIPTEPKEKACKVGKSPKKESLSCSSPEPDNTLENTIMKLVKEYGIEKVQNALDTLGFEET